jgi:hypothetical protein
MKRSFLLLSLIGLLTAGVKAQVGIGTSTPDASSMLEIQSTTKGLLPPRMTAAQRVSISSPASGLIVYQTDAPIGYYYYTGSVWTRLVTSSDVVTPALTSGYAANTSGATIAVLLGGTDIPFPNAQNFTSGVTVNGSNTTFTIANAGRYFITYRLNTTAGLLVSSRILLNGSSLPGSVVSPAISVNSFQSNVITNVAAGSTVSLQFYGLLGVAVLSGDASISIIRLQ